MRGSETKSQVGLDTLHLKKSKSFHAQIETVVPDTHKVSFPPLFIQGLKCGYLKKGVGASVMSMYKLFLVIIYLYSLLRLGRNNLEI